VPAEERAPSPETKNDAESGSGRDGPVLDSVRPGDHAQRLQVGRLHLGRPGGGRGASQMQSRPASEPRGEEEAAEGHGQVPLGPRHPGEDPGGGVQRGLRGAEEITAHVAPGQETLQDRDTQTGYLLYLLSQSRPGRLKVPPPSPRDTNGWGVGPQAPVWQSWQLRLMRGNSSIHPPPYILLSTILQNQNTFICKNKKTQCRLAFEEHMK
ncbi:unnamed protein product, partial [Tetraodon nigroviridis]